MDSGNLSQQQKGISTWQPFSQQSIQKAPRQSGVYIIRMGDGQCFGRLKGASDILYIGSSKAKGGLRQRLMHYFHPGPTQFTNIRINEFMKRYQTEIAWLMADEPVSLEHDLLRQYLKDHDEFPPLNLADIRRLYKSVRDKITLTDTVSVTKTQVKPHDE